MESYFKSFIFGLLLLWSHPIFGQTTLIRGPYLQVGTSTSIVIRWKTSVPTDSQVKTGLVQGSFTKIFDLSTSTTDHEVALDNLNPNTKYYYTVGSSQEVLQGDASNYFITYPIAGTGQKFRFWITGDCGNNSVNQHQVRDQYLNYIGNKPTDGWLLLGDNAYNSGLESEYDANFFSQYQESIVKHTVLWPAPGNHDYANDASLQVSKQIPYYDLFTLPSEAQAGGFASHSESYYSYNVGNIHFVALDSYGQESTNYRLYDTLNPQVEWLKKDLELNQQMWTIAYWHHPPYTKGSHDSDNENELVEIRRNFLRILERYNVDLVLCGHSHSYERSKLMKGHYDFSSTFNEEQFTESKSTALYDGTPNSCPYIKKTNQKGKGIVYVVSGSAGQVGGTTTGFPHPAMFYSDRTHGGSLILEIEKNRLDLKWLTAEGSVGDSFTMMKNVSTNEAVTLSYGDTVELTASWIGSYEWDTKNESTQSISVSPKTDTVYVVGDKFNCLADTFKVTIDWITSVKDSNGKNFDIELFPNPSDKTVWIKLPHHGFKRVYLMDAIGQVVLIRNLCLDETDLVRMDLQDLQLKPGLYFISAWDEGAQLVKKLMIRTSQ